MKVIAAAMLAIAFSGQLWAERPPIVLADSSVGSFDISPGKMISVLRLRNAFPFYRVTQEIREGDSPDYHLFTVATYEGEKVVSFISYITDESMYEQAVVPLDEVLLVGGPAIDQYGVAPGERLSSALKKRKELEFGYGHMDSYLGRGKIWYLFYAGAPEGTRATFEQAKESDPEIAVISWPKPRWR